MSANCRLSVELLSLLPRPPHDGVYFSIIIHLVSKKKKKTDQGSGDGSIFAKGKVIEKQ